MDMESVMAKPN